jgi:hypothetical protein
MAKHEWSEESWEGTVSSGYRHCLVCKVFKTVPNQNEECPGLQKVPAGDPLAGYRELRARQRLAGQVRMAFPPQSIPDDVLLAYRARQLVRDAMGIGLNGGQVQELFWKAYTQETGVPCEELSPGEAAKAWAREEEILVVRTREQSLQETTVEETNKED